MTGGHGSQSVVPASENGNRISSGRLSSRLDSGSPNLSRGSSVEDGLLMWCEQLPGWEESLSNFKLDLLTIFEVDKASKQYELVSTVFDDVVTNFIGDLSQPPNLEKSAVEVELDESRHTTSILKEDKKRSEEILRQYAEESQFFREKIERRDQMLAAQRSAYLKDLMFYKESVMKLNLELDQYKDLKKTKDVVGATAIDVPTKKEAKHDAVKMTQELMKLREEKEEAVKELKASVATLKEAEEEVTKLQARVEEVEEELEEVKQHPPAAVSRTTSSRSFARVPSTEEAVSPIFAGRQKRATDYDGEKEAKKNAVLAKIVGTLSKVGKTPKSRGMEEDLSFDIEGFKETHAREMSRVKDEHEKVVRGLRSEIDSVYSTAVSEQGALVNQVVGAERTYWEAEVGRLKKDLSEAQEVARRLHDMHSSVICGLAIAIEAEYVFPPPNYEKDDVTDPKVTVLNQVEKQRTELVILRQSVFEREMELKEAKEEVEGQVGKLTDELAMVKTELSIAEERVQEAESAMARLQALVNQLQGSSQSSKKGSKPQEIVKNRRELVDKHLKSMPSADKDDVGEDIGAKLDTGSLGSLASVTTFVDSKAKQRVRLPSKEQLEDLKEKLQDIAAMLTIDFERWAPGMQEDASDRARSWVSVSSVEHASSSPDRGGDNKTPKSAGPKTSKQIEKELRAALATMRREKMALQTRLKQAEAGGGGKAGSFRKMGGSFKGMGGSFKSSFGGLASLSGHEGDSAPGRTPGRSVTGSSVGRENEMSVSKTPGGDGGDRNHSPEVGAWDGGSRVGKFLGEDDSPEMTHFPGDSLGHARQGARPVSASQAESGRSGAGKAASSSPMVWTSGASDSVANRQARVDSGGNLAPGSGESMRQRPSTARSAGTPRTSTWRDPRSGSSAGKQVARRQAMTVSSFQLGEEPDSNFFISSPQRQTSPNVVNFGGDILDLPPPAASPQREPEWMKIKATKPMSARARLVSSSGGGSGVVSMDAQSMGIGDLSSNSGWGAGGRRSGSQRPQSAKTPRTDGAANSPGFLDRMRSSTAHIRPSDSNGERSLGNQSLSAAPPPGQGPAPKSHSATSSRGGRGSGNFGMEVSGAQSDATGPLSDTTSPVRSGFVGSAKVMRSSSRSPTRPSTTSPRDLSSTTLSATRPRNAGGSGSRGITPRAVNFSVQGSSA